MYINNLTIGCNKPNQGKTNITSIAFLGDSITDDTWSSVAPGTYYEPPNPINHWTRIVARELNVQSYNFGIAGDSAINIATSPTRINDVIAKNPSHCTLAIGGNDIYGGQTPDQIMANINTIVTALRNVGITVILMWCPISPFGSTVDGNIQDGRLVEMATRYNNYAVANNLKFIDLTKSILCADFCPIPLYYLPDTIHPNTEGQSVIANYFLKELNVVSENLTYELEKDVTLMVFKATNSANQYLSLEIPINYSGDILCMYSGNITGQPSDKRTTNVKSINSTTGADFDLVTSYNSTGRYVCLIKNATYIEFTRAGDNTNTQLDYLHVLGNTVKSFKCASSGIKKINDKALINAVNLDFTDPKCEYMFAGNNLTEIPNIFKYYPNAITKLPRFMFSKSNVLEHVSNFLTGANIAVGSDFSANSLFYTCQKLRTISNGLLDNLNVCSTVNLTDMFFDCDLLTSIPNDLIPATPRITTDRMFYSCGGINTLIPDFWNTRPNITSHVYMFIGCSNAPNFNIVPNDWKY